MLWTVGYTKWRVVDLNALCKRAPLDNCGRPCLLPPPRGVHIRAVCWDAVEGRVLVGTASNEVVRIQILRETESATVITQGHQGGWMRSVNGGRVGGGVVGGAGEAEESWRMLRGLSQHPQLPQFATAGDDGAVKVWSLTPHRLHAARRLRSAPCCVSYAPDGEHLAVGCADGSLVVLLAPTLSVLREVPCTSLTAPSSAAFASSGFGTSLATSSSSAAAVDASATTGSAGGAAALSYSPDGRLLALADGTKHIRLFLVRGSDGSADRSYRHVKTCVGHTGVVTHLGWATDSSCLRSNCDCLELRFWDCDGVEVPAADKKLATLTFDGGALYTRETLGVHVSADGADTRVRAIGVSHGTAGRLMAVGDEFQQLRLSSYPSLTPSAAEGVHSCVGHAAPLSAVRFSFNDRYVISAGGEDLTVFVWRVQPATSALTAATPTVTAAAETGLTQDSTALPTAAGGGRGGSAASAVAGSGFESDEGEEDDSDDSDVESSVGFGGAPKSKPRGPVADDESDDDDVFVAEEASAGEQLGALKPWHAAIKAPTNAPPPEAIDCSPPEDELDLSWIYGFRGFDTRRAALWAGDQSSPKIVYPVAAVVVVYDTRTHTQTYFREHKDDVLGLAVHGERRLVASSQKSYREGGRTRKPTIWVWSSVDAKALKGPLVFTGCNQRWVSLLCFNGAGDLLCSVGADDDNTLVLWAWEKGEALCHVPTQKERIYACRFMPSTIPAASASAAVSAEPASGASSALRSYAGRLVLAGKGFARLCVTEELAEAGLGQRKGETKLALPGRERAAAQLTVGFLQTGADAPSGLAAIGSASGAIHVFDLSSGKLVVSTKEAHRGPVHVIAEAGGLTTVEDVQGGEPAAAKPTVAGGLLLSCGKDGVVRLWGWHASARSLTPLSAASSLALDTALPLLCGGRGGARLRSMDWDPTHGLLLGTHASELLLVRQAAEECRVLVHGHSQRPTGSAAAAVAAAAKTPAAKLPAEDLGESELGALRAVAAPHGSNSTVCVSGGDDAVLRLWDLSARRLLAARPVASAITALSFDEAPLEVVSDGGSETLRLAVGMESGAWEVLHVTLPATLGDGGTSAQTNGKSGGGGGGAAAPPANKSTAAAMMMALETQAAAFTHPAADPPRRINDLRFSPDSRWLAVASADAVIYLHQAPLSTELPAADGGSAADAGYTQVARCCGHSSGVTHIDWTTSSDVIRSNDLGHELRFWDVPSGEAIAVASACRDLPWASARVTLGYHCQGIFRNRADGTGVHAVDRSADAGLLVTADDLGQLNLFRNPCVRASGRADEPGHPNRKSFAAHASAALDCQWARDDGSAGAGESGECVVSAGGYDLALMVWARRKR